VAEIDALSMHLKSLTETVRLGKMLGELAQSGEVICLDGDLGAGKTTLAQAIAVGLQVPSTYYVTSPSFAIFHEYPGRIPLYHMDFYRLNDSSEIVDLGLDEYFYLKGLTVIEWSERGQDLLPEDHLHIRLENAGENKRTVRCIFTKVWGDRIAKIKQDLSSTQGTP